MSLSNNVSGEHWEGEFNFIYAIEQIFAPFTVLLTVLTNLLLLFYEGTRRHRRNSVNIPRLLVLLLSGANIIAISLGYLPVWIHSLSVSTPKRITLLHVVCSFFLKSFWTLSKCLVVFMGIERFTSINKPYFYVRYFDVSMIGYTVSLLSTYSASVAAFSVLAGLKQLDKDVPYLLIFSTFSLHAYEYVSLCQSVVLLSILLFCNISVMRTLRAMEANVSVACPRNREEYIRQMDLVNGTGREFSRLMATISFVFLVSSMPGLIRVICRRCDILESPMADYMAYHISLMTGSIDPFLYGLLRKKIRETVRLKIKNTCSCFTINQVHPSSVTGSSTGDVT